MAAVLINKISFKCRHDYCNKWSNNYNIKAMQYETLKKKRPGFWKFDQCLVEYRKGYDLMNRLMTFGMDISWRRFLLRMAAIPEGGRILDVGVGTGDIAFEALKNNPELRVTGVDFTWEMMATGRERGGDLSIGWCRADAMELPFPDQTFDAVTSGFLVRNVIDVPAVIKEQVRVLKPGLQGSLS